MYPQTSEAKFQDHARDLNALLRRIATAEATLFQLDPGYTSRHGFDVNATEIETGGIYTTAQAQARITAISANPVNNMNGKMLPPRKATMLYGGEELQRIRRVTQQQGQLHNGSMGDRETVAAELEGLVLSLTGAKVQNGGCNGGNGGDGGDVEMEDR